jgi:hypothetical protein
MYRNEAAVVPSIICAEHCMKVDDEVREVKAEGSRTSTVESHSVQ